MAFPDVLHFKLVGIAIKVANNHQGIRNKKRDGPADFSDVDRWSISDWKSLRRQTDDMEDDTLKLEDESLSLKTEVAELQSLLLKGMNDTHFSLTVC